MKRQIRKTHLGWTISWLIPMRPAGWFRIHTRPATDEEIHLYGDTGTLPEDTATFVSPDGEEFEI